MNRTFKYKTEKEEEHLLLLTFLHTYSQKCPEEITEVHYNQAPSQRGVFTKRSQSLSSVYHLDGVTLKHYIGEEDHLSLIGRLDNISRALNKLQQLTKINLLPLSLEGRIKNG